MSNHNGLFLHFRTVRILAISFLVCIFFLPQSWADEKAEDYILFISSSTFREEWANNLLDTVEESNRLESAFLANMSPEIRTPLNAIVGSSSILATEATEEERVEYLRVIEQNNELLLYTDQRRITQGINNFISNPMKFTAAGSITVGYDQSDNGYIRLFVTDTGRGSRSSRARSELNRSWAKVSLSGSNCPIGRWMHTALL